MNLESDELPAYVDRARALDPDAWDALYRHAYPRLHAYCRRRLGSDQEADDAVSEAMARAIAGIGSFTMPAPGGGGFEGWLFGICRNVVLERWRADGRDARWQRAGRRLVGGDGDDPSDALVLDVEHTQVRRAFDQLPDRDQEVLELRVVAGLDASAAGAVLGMGAGAVRMAQVRALGRLRSLLADGGGEP